MNGCGCRRTAVKTTVADANFAPLLIDGADRSLILLGDDEHRWSMRKRALVG
jgi:hypothetical protein